MVGISNEFNLKSYSNQEMYGRQKDTTMILTLDFPHWSMI